MAFFLLSPLHAAGGQVDIDSKVDRSHITIGDRLEYDIRIEFPAEGNVILPSVLGNLGSFEVKSYDTDRKPAKNGRRSETHHFVLSTFTVGTYTLPPQRVEYRDSADTTALTLFTQPIEIVVERTSAETVKDIADIDEIIPARQASWLGWLWGALALTVLGLLVWFLLRRKAATLKETPQLPPWEEARAALDPLQVSAFIRSNRARELAFTLSHILRRYLSRRYGVDALESTNTEFLELTGNLPLNGAQKAWIGSFCESAESVKFAGQGLLESDGEAWTRGIRELLDATRPTAETAPTEKGKTAS
jgi:hypothetical protein